MNSLFVPLYRVFGRDQHSATGSVEQPGAWRCSRGGRALLHPPIWPAVCTVRARSRPAFQPGPRVTEAR